MSEKVKQSALVAFVVVALIAVGISAFKFFAPVPDRSAIKQTEAAKKMTPEQLKRLPPYIKKMVDKERAESK